MQVMGILPHVKDVICYDWNCFFVPPVLVLLSEVHISDLFCSPVLQEAIKIP